MQRLSVLIVAALFNHLAANAAPLIYPHYVVNAASYYAPGLPAGSIAQGSIFSIFGAGLGPAQGTQATTFPLGTALAGVSVLMTQGSTTVSALPVYVVQGQINALMPSNTPLGWNSLSVTYNGFKSNPSPVYIVHDSPGIFTFTGTGIGPAALQNAVSATSLPLNSNHTSAAPGQTEILYLTGLGPITTPDNLAPPAGNVVTPVEVWVGGIPASVTYSGRSPCCSGLDQIDFVVPATAPQGCWVPVYVRTSNTAVSNFTSMAISAKGGPCSEPSNPLASVFVNGGKVAQLTLARVSVLEDVGTRAAVEVASEVFSIGMSQEAGGLYAFAPFLSLPPAGTCTVYSTGSDFFSNGSLPVASTSVRPLNAGGPFSLTGPNSTVRMTATNPAIAAGYLGSFAPYLPTLPNQLLLNPSNYNISAPGGADVGAFKVPLTVAQPFTWSNRSQLGTVDRSQPLTVDWAGAPAGATPAVFGGTADLPTNSSAIFYCISSPGATSLTVPSVILSAIPASRGDLLKSKSVIYLGDTPESNATSVSIPGIDAAVAAPTLILGKTVIFK